MGIPERGYDIQSDAIVIVVLALKDKIQLNTSLYNFD